MRVQFIGLLSALGLALGLGGTNVIGQSEADTVEAHVAAARALAGQDQPGIFNAMCTERQTPAPQPSQPRAARRSDPPPRSEWYAEPIKVFDNLYFVGTKPRSVWAVTTSDGIIVIDTIADWSVEAEVVDGLKKLGLDPAQIKYAVVSHAHADHYGGARYLQEHFGTRVVMSAMDWDLVDRSPEPRPKRDIIVGDGDKLTLGDTTLTFYLTPGHTLGTISTLIPLKDGGRSHLAALWGGTGFNWLGRARPDYMASREVGDRFWFETYIRSAQRFRDIVDKAGADVPLANHTTFDSMDMKLASLAKRRPGDPHAYVLGKDGVRRYLTIAEECAKAGLLRAISGQSN